MSFKARTCQNDFLRSPFVLFAAILRDRLILVFCVTIPTVDSGRKHPLFVDSILLLGMGRDGVTFLDKKTLLIPGS